MKIAEVNVMKRGWCDCL